MALSTKKLAFAVGGVMALTVFSAQAALVFRNTITGEVLDLNEAIEEGRDTPAVKEFLETGTNPYIERSECLPIGHELFLSACSGCHGHLGEGKVGPGLNDAYWTYPKNATNVGLFETMFGGAQGQMGPMYGALTLDEMLLVQAWIRHIYTGSIEDAEWLSDEQKKTFTPYKPPASEDADVHAAALAAAEKSCKRNGSS